MCTLFIADLHLSSERPAIGGLVLKFLLEQAPQAEAVYILGDLFEAWIGDDDQSDMNLSVCQGLRQCAASGTPVFVMHGNRDFLLGERFAQQSNTTLLQDPTLIDLYGTPTLLMHGDLLCTDDTEYMSFREMVHDPQWQTGFLVKPLEQRHKIAVDMRTLSQEKTSDKAEAIMDVNQAAVIQTMAEHQVPRLIHGHTHRPDTHELLASGERVQRFVLGDWYEQGSVLECSPDGCKLQSIAIK